MNKKNKKILVIIPAYNEGANIASVIEGIKGALPFADILVVNDASKDQTSLIARQKEVIVLDMPFNMGIGAAMQMGYCFAREFGYDKAVQFDADGQHRPEELINMLNIISSQEVQKNIDMVIASRFLLPGGFKSSLLRKMGIRYFSFLIFLFTGKRITDPTSGFRMINHGLIELFSENYAEDYPEPEAVVLALKKGFSITEIPTFMRARNTGVSSITPLKAVYYMFKVSIAIFLLGLSPGHP